MAIAFELVADFGGDRESAERCRQWLESRTRPIDIDQYTINIHPPLISGYPYTNPTRFKVSVVPANIGCAVALDETDDQLPLNDDQLSRLGKHLYASLCGAPGYQLARVGWDVDFLLDVDELKLYWAPEIGNGSFGGLVALKTLLQRLPQSNCFVDFDDEHVWIPYTGSQAI